MRSASHIGRTTLIVAAGFVAGLAAGAAASADLNEVTVTYDRDVAARTNMGRSVAEESKLGVTFDQDVAKRTNMQREATDVGAVSVKPDMDIRTRTNMGGVARIQPQQPNAPATAAVEHGTALQGLAALSARRAPAQGDLGHEQDEQSGGARRNRDHRPSLPGSRTGRDVPRARRAARGRGARTGDLRAHRHGELLAADRHGGQARPGGRPCCRGCPGTAA